MSHSLNEFKVVNSQPISTKRIENSSFERIEEWFKKATAKVRPLEIHPALFWNMDETMLDSTARKVKVLSPRNSKPLRIKSNESEGQHITLIFCVAADGGHLTPSIILPLKEFPPNLLAFSQKFFWAGQSSGWMTSEIFKHWAINSFIPHVNARRMAINRPEERALLMLDSHGSRRNVEALRALQAAKIDVFTFPSHTSHILQPLDCGINRSFKMKLRANQDLAQYSTVEDRRFALVKKAAKAVYDAMYPDSVQEAWAQAGIFPWSLERMKTSRYVIPTLPPEIVGQSRKRKRSSISISEKLLTSDEVILELERHNEKKEAPKRPRGRPKKKAAEDASSGINIDNS